MVGLPCFSRVATLGAVLGVVSASGVRAVNPGQLDISFGQGGWATVVFDFAPWSGLQPARLVAAANGRIFACGEVGSWSGVDSDFALAALTSSGEYDPTFDGDGRQVLPFDLLGTGQGDDGAYGIALAPDGALVVVGLSEYAYGDYEAVAARERPVEGVWQLDPSFAGDGKFIWSLGGGDSRYPQLVGVKVMDGGRIVAAGNRNSWQDYFHVPFVSRLLAESASDETAPDPSFGTQGLFLFGDSSKRHDIYGLDVSSKGKVVAGGITVGDNGAMLVFRLLESGQLDPSFAGTGWRTVELPNGYQETARTVAIAADGSMYLAGDAARNGEGAVLVVKLLESGELDPAFGTGGYSVIVSGALGTVLRANAVVVQGDGRAVVGGEDYDDDPHYLALRLTPDGALDPSFGSGGIASLLPTQPGVTQAYGAWDMAMQADGRILLLGICQVAGIYGACVARLENDYIFGDGFEGSSTRGWTSVCLLEPCPGGP